MINIDRFHIIGRMSYANVQKLDLNLLVVLAALTEHQSVSRAGDALGLSQPAMSAALAKLRGQLNDPLFVRTGKGMRPTARALELREPIARLLGGVQDEILHKTCFDPTTAQRTFRVITSDIGEAVLMPRLYAHLAQQAPGVTLETLAMQPNATEAALESGTAHLAIGYLPDLAKRGFYQQTVLRTSFSCIVRAGHPFTLGPVTLEAYLAASHAVVRPAERMHLFEQFLESHGLAPRVRLRVGHYTSLLTIVVATDLVAMVPLEIAQLFESMADVRCVTPPVQPPPFDIKQHWHERFHKDPAITWLRASVHALFSGGVHPAAG